MDKRFDAQLAEMSAKKRSALEMSHEYLMPNRVETWLAAGVPLSIGRREAYRIWDVDGQELQDFHLNGGVFNLGHRHPHLVETLRNGLDTLDVGNHHFPSALRATLAKDLAEKAPGDLHYTIFTRSGSEANDSSDINQRAIITIGEEKPNVPERSDDLRETVESDIFHFQSIGGTGCSEGQSARKCQVFQCARRLKNRTLPLG